MGKNIKNLVAVLLISTIPTFFIWLPFFFRLQNIWGIPLPKEGMATIVANYDGPLYIATAKSIYNPQEISNFEFGLPSQYYAAHFPLFPLLVRFVGRFTGYPYALLGVTLFSSVLALYFFSRMIGEYVEKREVIWITIVFALLPARWLIVRSIGSPEPLFVAAIIASLLYFKKKKYFLAGIWGAIAQLTKSPGILLFLAYLVFILFPNLKFAATSTFSRWKESLNLRALFSISLIPLALVLVFTLYKIRLNDFFAYFHSGDNIHLFFPPFQIFNYSQPWVGTFWLEEIIFVYLFGILGVLKLIKMREYAISSFVGLFFVSTLFVSHRDLIRYSLPIVPFLFIAFSETVLKKEFKIVMLVLIIPIYLFSLAFIAQNAMHISNWEPLL